MQVQTHSRLLSQWCSGLLYAAAFFMPWWQMGLDLSLFSACAVMAVLLWREPARLRALRWPGVALMLFAAWAYCTTWLAPEPSASAYNFFYRCGTYAAMYLLVTWQLRTREQCVHFLSYLLAGAVIVCVIGVYQYFFGGFDGFTMEWVDRERFPLLLRRMYSTLGNPNLLGAYLLIIASVLASFTAIYERGYKRLLLAAFLLLILLVLLLTYSRGAWVSMLVVLTVTAIIYDRRVAWGLLAVPAFLWLHHGQITERFISLFRGGDTSVDLRFAFWRSTWQMIGDHWSSGIGWAAFPLVYPHYDYYIQDPSIVIYHAHNLYLTVLAETGIIGFALYMLAFWGHGVLAWRSYRISDSHLARALSLGVLLAVVGMSINGLFDYNFFHRTVALTFWTLCALQSALSRLGQR